MPSNSLKRFLLLFLLTVSATLCAQDWKQTYSSALALYQDQRYQEALPLANKAYTLSKSLEPKNQAYTLQLITSICLEANLNDEGLAKINEEETLFKKLEGEGTTYVETLRKHSLLLLQKGSNQEALEKCKTALGILKTTNQENELSYGMLLSEKGQIEALLGDVNGAKTSLDQSLNILGANPEAGEDYLNALVLSARVEKNLKNYPVAEKKYRDILVILEKNNLQKSELYGESKAALSGILLLKGNSLESTQTIQNENVAADQKAAQLLKIAVDFHNHKQFEKAFETYAAAEKVAEDGQLANNTAFSIYLNYGKALLETGDVTSAAEQLGKANTIRQKLYQAGTLEYVLLDYAMADLNLAQHNVKAAVDLYMKLAAVTVNLPPSIRKQLSLRAGAQLLNDYQYESAVEYLVAAGAGKTDSQTINDYYELVILYAQALMQSNRIDQALAILQKDRSLTTDVSVRNSYDLALSQVLERKGELSRANAILSALLLNTSLTEEQKMEVTYQWARIKQQLGQYSDAERGFRNVILALNKKTAFESQLQLQAYNSLAVLLTQLGNYTEAERLYTDLLKNKNLPEDFALTVRENLATIYEESLQIDKARVLLEQVAEADRKRLGDHNPELAITLQNLATLYQKTGDLASAKKYLEEAIQIDKETMGVQNSAYATKMANLGVVQQQLGNLPESRRLFQEALTIHEKTLGKEHPDYMFNAYNLAVSLQQSNDFNAAAPLFREVSRFYRKEIQELFPAMSEQEKAAFFNKINEIILAYLDFGLTQYNKFPELKGELYDFRLSTKALLYNASSTIRNKILAGGDTLLLAHFTEWQKTKDELGKLNQLDAQERILADDQILKLRQRANALEKTLSEKSLSFGNENQQASVDWKKVKASLQKGQAAVEMIRLRLNLKNDSVIYAALILRPEVDQPEIVILPQGRKMERRDFFYYRNCIKYQIRNELSYNTFWKPIEDKLKGVQTIYFSPDGIYNKINILTLMEPKSGKYVLESARIKLVSNTRELLAMSKPKTGQGAALFGRPDFITGAKSQVVIANPSISDLDLMVLGGIADLPGTEDEVKKIDSLLKSQKWQPQLFLGGASTEAAIRAQKDIRVLHIATHGFFIPAEQDDEPIMLSPDFRQPAKNPLLRSGLILSGSQKSVLVDKSKRNFSEDGILTAYEVQNLNLDKTELVILSACETGAGEIQNGEGVFGLQRSFLLAGAGSLVMSLWKVDDDATRQMMVEFYKQWITNHDKSDALHKTMLNMKSRLAEPYYWGGFAMVGIN